MASAVNMPQVGQDLETAIIREWHVKEGDMVNKGDSLATVESDKASFEVESFESGTVLKLLFQEGEEAKVFNPIAYIGNKDEIVNTNKPIEDTNYKLVKTKSNTSPNKNISKQRKQFISPSAKRLAKEKNIDTSTITGSGPNGRIIKKDIVLKLEIEEAGNQKRTPGTPLPGTGPIKAKVVENDRIIPFSKMRGKIAERLLLSKQTIPHFYLFSEIDFTDIIKWRITTNKKLGTKISVNDLIIKLVADTLQNFNYINAHISDKEIILKKDINIGFAVATDDGLLVPVIPNADTKNLGEISSMVKTKATKAQKGTIDADGPGTFTISNLGMFGINRFQAIINPPESAILSVGGLEKKVVPGENGILFRDYVTFGLACDHRAIDGAYAAKFLKALKENIESFVSEAKVEI